MCVAYIDKSHLSSGLPSACLQTIMVLIILHSLILPIGTECFSPVFMEEKQKVHAGFSLSAAPWKCCNLSSSPHVISQKARDLYGFSQMSFEFGIRLSLDASSFHCDHQEMVDMRTAHSALFIYFDHAQTEIKADH